MKKLLQTIVFGLLMLSCTSMGKGLYFVTGDLSQTIVTYSDGTKAKYAINGRFKTDNPITNKNEVVSLVIGNGVSDILDYSCTNMPKLTMLKLRYGV